MHKGWQRCPLRKTEAWQPYTDTLAWLHKDCCDANIHSPMGFPRPAALPVPTVQLWT